MEQSAFELKLLRLLVTSTEKDEVGLPQWQGLEYLFYDKFAYFDGITKETYKKYVLSMIAKGLLFCRKHDYKETQHEHWTISVTTSGFNESKLIEEQ